MANTHYGRLGDVWKHLPLAEVLHRTEPREYWETHAGSARYPLPAVGADWTRDFGVHRFAEHAVGDGSLGDSAYARLLGGSLRGDDPHYPGSSTQAMRLLGAHARYVFCDTDPVSVRSLQVEVEGSGLTDWAEVHRGDGLARVAQLADELPPADRAGALVHIDPFDPHAADTEGGPSAIELAGALAEQGFGVAFWYGLDEAEERGWAWRALTAAGPRIGWWAAELSLAALGLPGIRELPNPGVGGCGLALANVDRVVHEPIIGQQRAMVDAWADALMSGNYHGALVATVYG